jgi:hypothetical protein
LFAAVTVQPPCSKVCSACFASPVIVVLFRTTRGSRAGLLDELAPLLGLRDVPADFEPCPGCAFAVWDAAGELPGRRLPALTLCPPGPCSAMIATTRTTTPRTASAMPASRSRRRLRA